MNRSGDRPLSSDSGFSLLEVMISIAILAIALVTLTRTVTGDVRATQHSRMMTAATFLARTKISSLEQNILEVGVSVILPRKAFPASSGMPPSSG